MNTTGYLNNSPHRFNNKNVIPGNIITMDNVDIPLLLRPNKGKSIIAMPNSGKYNFPKASYVTEIPLNSYQSGGSYFDKTGYHYKNLLNNFQQNNNNNFTDCPEGYVKDETGQCVLDNGFNPSQYQNKGMPIIPKLNINNQSVGGVGAISTNQNNISNQNQSQDMKLKRIFGTPNIPAILATNLLGFGLASFANNVEQGRQKAAMQQQMNNPLFNGSYSFAQNDYGVDPYEQTGQLRPTFQKGGRMPIIVTNPNDSRLKAYNDSLSSYKQNNRIRDAWDKDLEYFAEKTGKDRLRKNDWKDWIKREEFDKNTYQDKYNYGKHNDGKGRKDAVAPFDNKLNGIKPYKIGRSTLLGLNTDKPVSLFDVPAVTEYPIYKKPVQPVVYQKKPIFKRPEPNPITPIEFNPSNASSVVPLPNMQRAEWDASKPTPFVFTNATGNYLEGKNTYFPDEQSLRKFAENQKNVSIQSSDSGATATGYLKSMLKGGIHINPENKGKFNATKARTGKTTEELTHSKNPLTRKRAIFAQNAAKWKHQYGGQFDPIDYLYGNEEEQKADTIEAPIKQVKQKRITEEDVDSMNNQMAFDILNMDSLSTAKKYPIQNNSEYLSMYLKHQQGEAGYNAIAKAASQGLEYVPRNWNKENIQFNMQRNVGKDFKGKLTPASFINYWNDKFNRHMQIAANKQTPYDSIFNKVGEEEGINPLFLKTVANIESGLNPNNNTAFKYKGLFAMNSKTFKGNIFDPYQNSKVAAQNFKRFEQGGVFDVDFDMLVKLQEKGIKFKIIE